MLLQNAIKRSDMISCLLCKDAPCSKACCAFEPGEALRSIWFDNSDVAALRLPESNPCMSCNAPCEGACISDSKVPVKKLMTELACNVRSKAEIELPEDEERLKCDICGVPLENPFLLSSSVVASTYDMCARAFEAGWAGACFKILNCFKFTSV